MLVEPSTTTTTTTTTTSLSFNEKTTLEPPHQREPYTPPPHKMTHVDDMPTTDITPTSTPTPTPAKRRRRSKPSKPTSSTSTTVDSLWNMLRKGIVQHQLGLSVNLMLLVLLLYIAFPALREKMTAFFGLSYHNPTPTSSRMYGQGPRDLYLVGSFIVLFTALRAFSLDYLLLPLAGYCGIAKKKDRIRFAEQSYMLLYYATYWTWGLILFLRNTPSTVTGLESLLISLWTDFPHLLLGPGMKLYYLSQFAFWIQQVAVIHLEEPRKDHYQMLSHHVITIALLAGSYPYRQWRVGNAILVCMDLVDFIFPAAKILKYLQLQTACDAAFALFVVSWLVSRHIAYGAICWSIYAHVNTVTMGYGTYSTRTGERVNTDGGSLVLENLFQPILWPGKETVGFNARIRWTFLGLLGALQGITIAWFVMIVRVVVRVLRGEGADDSRSEAEDGEEEDDEEDVEVGEMLEDEELGVEDVPPEQPSSPLLEPKAAGWQVQGEKPSPRYIEIEADSTEDVHTYSKHRSANGGASGAKRKAKGISSGLNLGEHKEILNRIGCLSEEQLAREREMRSGSGKGGGGGGGSGSANGSPRPAGSGGRK
ncbi:Sphingosine N-acyltransferase lag1 [Recurvomyces mirabilis]|uniref:Sphingosine N-acyltransferase lag1 n=1 Tax=Recurvomyces mirabilis TaxID=574656 RepID=A0AAE0WSA0_9PEZI|nr:Sphingosine N-acyltransferase lag1 [Recurvomyces mirabilis]KAK5156988.1 Sphingosine N-acyltransferase lag1 [Recurvomyces mirabilis]